MHCASLTKIWRVKNWNFFKKEKIVAYSVSSYNCAPASMTHVDVPVGVLETPLVGGVTIRSIEKHCIVYFVDYKQVNFKLFLIQ